MSEPDDDDYEIECPYCDGDGWVVISLPARCPALRAECPECGGSGWY